MAYSRENYNRDMKKASQEYNRILRKTGDHEKAFVAENKIAMEALRKYESANPARGTKEENRAVKKKLKGSKKKKYIKINRGTTGMFKNPTKKGMFDW